MAYEDKEVSNQESRPIGLYKLQWGNTIWRYTSADRTITLNESGVDRDYLPVAISDNGMVQGGSQDNDFTITVPSDLPIVALFRGTPPSAPIYMTVRRKDYAEPDAPVYWIGTVANLRRPDDVSAEIIGATLTSSFKRSGLRLSWQKTCPHILYDHGCKLNPEDFGVAGTVTDKTGTSITVTGAAVGNESSYIGGFIKWDAEGNGTYERRGIEGTSGAGVFLLYGRPDRLEIGADITLYPGCRHTPTACNDDFDNLANYGGFEFLPGKSPFDGTPVF